MKFNFNEQNTFCISLYSNSERWEKMQNRFEKLKMSVTRWKAR